MLSQSGWGPPQPQAPRATWQAAHSAARAPATAPWRRPPPAAAAAPRRRLRVASAAATEQGRDSTRTGGRAVGGTQPSSGSAGNNSATNGWSGAGNGGAPDSLLLRIAACTTASQLHQLLLRHSAELRVPEVVAALEAAAQRKLLAAPAAAAAAPDGQPPPGGAAAAALASLLVQLAERHVRMMDPAALSAAAQALGMLQLQPARPVVRAMHAAAQQHLLQHSPSQLCSLLWAGSALDPAFRSPLLLALGGLLQRGMSLALFGPQELAMLAWLCGRDGGNIAKDVLTRVVVECRTRLETYTSAVQAAAQEAAMAEAAEAVVNGPGFAINFVQDCSVADVLPAFGAPMKHTALKKMISVVKRDLAAATAGDVLVQLQLQLCGREDLDPLLLVLEDGEPVNEPLDQYASYRYTHRLAFRVLPRLEGLQQAAAGVPPGLGSEGGKGVAALSREQAGDVLQRCTDALAFWEAVVPRASQVKVDGVSTSFTAVARMAAGRRLALTWRRRAREVLPVEVSELPSAADEPLFEEQWQAVVERLRREHAHMLRQQQRQREAAAAAPPPALPPPPFGPKQAAMLLTALAQLQMRVAGVVEPLLLSCEAGLPAANVSDVARILAALGQLQMEPAGERLHALVDRLAAGRDRLAPSQMVAVMWGVARVSRPVNRVVGIGMRHLASHLADYRTVDVVGMLWACAQLNGTVPDESLEAALQRLPAEELASCSNTALCNLLWALGRLTCVQCGWDRRTTGCGRRAVAVGTPAWLACPAGGAAQAASLAAATELAQRCRRLRPRELAGAAVALAAHEPQLWAPPAAATAALRGACAAATAADAFTSADLASLAAAAARLGWDDPPFVAALVDCLQPRLRALLQPGDVARALAMLAPADHPRFFAALGRCYCMKARALREMQMELDERATALQAFAVVAHAQGLQREVVQELLQTVSVLEVRRLPAAGLASLLDLAAHAQADRASPLVQACLQAVPERLPTMGSEQLRQTRSALHRLGCDAALLAAVDERL